MSSSTDLFQPKDAIFAPPTAIASLTTTPGTSSSGSTTTSTTPTSASTTLHKLILPSCYHSGSERILTPIHTEITSSNKNLQKYLEHDLNVQRLNDIHRHLWLAGLPLRPRPLHIQKQMGRSIIITEKCDLHLLWRGRELYLKPLPEYLLSHEIWTEFLNPLSNKDLYASASGFLYSYINLIASKSDLHIAKEASLLSKSITWEQWTTFTSAVVSSLHSFPITPNTTPSPLNKRYIYGELRLARINFVYRATRRADLFKAYHHHYVDYKSFFGRNFAWVITVVVYVTVVLTAMQVGLATEQLGSSKGFNRASFGFTVFAIIGPLAVVGFVLVFGLGLVLYHLRYALGKRWLAKPLDKGESGGGSTTTATSTATATATTTGSAVNGIPMQKLNGRVNGNVNGNNGN